jgi:hypothetical protein
MLRSTARSLAPEEGTLTPFMVTEVRLGLNPLTTTLEASPPFLIREIPGKRPIASAAFNIGQFLDFVGRDYINKGIR